MRQGDRKVRKEEQKPLESAPCRHFSSLFFRKPNTHNNHQLTLLLVLEETLCCEDSSGNAPVVNWKTDEVQL